MGLKDASSDGGLKRGTGDEDFTQLVKNTYRVLLSRGLRGCYVHFVDEQTRNFVESRIDLANVFAEAQVDMAAEGHDA